MSMVIGYLMSFTSAHSLILFNQVLYDGRIKPLNKALLLSACLFHDIQKLQMAYLFTPDAPRDCWALVTVGNVFGLVPFRLTIMWLFGQLLLTLGKGAMWAKACWVIGQLATVASCILLLVVEYTAPPDPVFCFQTLEKSLESANNGVFLCAFGFIALPIIGVLVAHIKHQGKSKGMSISSGLMRVYVMQIGFMTVFTVTYLFVTIGGWFWSGLYPALYGYIFADYIWLLAIYMWLLPEPPQSSATNSVMQSAVGTKTAVGGRGSLLPDRRTSTAIQETRKITEENV
ncbi:hypothetical protein BDZ88DRAFT_409491 [Geranomyces variabilis]|nr:hypothetical protein BDZ88DRAFT_409491 [Geranomyces variabilis]KAJ3132268.1 hypothetical protein HDU90_007460 [Geranomyces variabilis]